MDERGHQQRGITGRLSRLIGDVVQQTSGMAVVVGCVAVFLVAAIGGLSLRSALGDFGWIAYGIVLGVIALALGPVLATGFTLRQKGSARHRDEHAQRLAEQRRKFGLVAHEAERRRDGREADGDHDEGSPRP